jgi:two-component system, chemotaxis family, protein-glutamate methylesterase/glutaminase
MDGNRHIEAIVIGASAGGVEAVCTLLAALPAAFGPPVVILLHLPPGRPTTLPQLFSRYTSLPVKEAEDKERIERQTVYLAPPDYHLLVEPEKCFALSADEPHHFSRPSIDLLFESAAYAYRENLLAVVLTGASSDGAAGLQAVRALRGIAWVQDPAEANVSIMPDAALALAGADRVLSLKDMADALHRMDQLNHG